MIRLSAPNISIRERLAVDRVLRSGNLAQGIHVQEFENGFSKFVNSRKCVAVNSGTSGLIAALMSAGIQRGDEVIVPSFTFAATANSVVLAGAKPIFADIDLDTFNIDIEHLESLISPKTKAIQVVHLFGLPADMPSIMKIAERYNLLVFEDAAQSHLAEINGRSVGDFGIASTFSFYPTKNMTSGEGGMIACGTEEVFKRSRLLRNQGMEVKYRNEIAGFNFRMSEVHAAIGLVQLQRIEKWTQKRIENANFFLKNIENVILPKVKIGYKHVFHQFTIRVEERDRDSLTSELRKQGVETGIFYPSPVHKLDSFGLDVDLPNTEIACRSVFSIPVHPRLKKWELDKIARTVNKVASAGK